MALFSNSIVKEDMMQIVSQTYIPFEELKEKTILITGATGMLAYYMTSVCMYLNIYKNYNTKVIALVRNEKKAKDKFAEFLEDDNFKLCVQDICAPLRIDEEIDYIVHAAGSASPWFIKNDPVGIIKANTVGTMNVLELSRTCHPDKVLFLSTREIYGEVLNTQWIKESDMGILDPMDARSCYPESKRMAEQLFESYNKMYQIPYTLARIAHSYGPGMIIDNDGRVMADFISDTVHERDIILKSEGLAERAFCYISDAVSALFLLLLEGASGEAYNVANETEPMAIRDVAEMLVEQFPGDGRKVVYDIQSDTSGYCSYKRVGLDTSKLEKLGWKPVVALKQGLINTVRSFQ